MTYLEIAILLITAALGGAINSVAGGGSFLTFPALIFTGLPAIQANATSTVALWPGSLASIGAYRHEMAQQGHVPGFVVVSLLGGLAGAVLLLYTPPVAFDALLPYLLLFATVLFTFGKRLAKRLPGSHLAESGRISWRSVALQFLIAVYGGFFGGGIGILTLATLRLMGIENVHRLNALKVLLVACINGIAVATFVWADIVVWHQGLLMMLGAVVGGYAGAYYARKTDPRLIRGLVIATGAAMTIYFFLKGYL